MIEPTTGELADLAAIADATRRQRRTEVTPEQAGIPVARLWALHVRGLAWGHDRARRWCLTTTGVHHLTNPTRQETPA